MRRSGNENVFFSGRQKICDQPANDYECEDGRAYSSGTNIESLLFKVSAQTEESLAMLAGPVVDGKVASKKGQS